MDEKLKTNDQETLADLKAKVAALEADLATKDVVIDGYRSRDEGWLVLTPNILYDGITADVQFHNGAAFIRKDQIIPRFQVEVPSPNILAQYPIEEQEKILKNCAMPTSERAIIHLTRDFGYVAEFYSKDQSEELARRLEPRAKERKELQAKADKQGDMLERLMSRSRI